MKSRKWIFSIAMVFLAMNAWASTTKVGNGDDGRDLEGAEPITSGPIFEARAAAVRKLKALNIQGVPGLGGLLPELEQTELLMTKFNTRPLFNEGDFESSDDRHHVYARTFAEPHAPTRFFPAALSLTQDQLIALQTHEALHRALPPNVRENEDRVAYLTLAITSPSATFDRIRRVAQNVLEEPLPHQEFRALASGISSTAIPEQSQPTRAPTRTQLRFADHVYSKYRTNDWMESAGIQFSPLGVKEIAGTPAELLLSLDAYYLQASQAYRHMGPLSFTSKLPFYLEPRESLGPLFQYNMKSAEDSFADEIERDVYTVGGFFESQQAGYYSKVQLTYTFGGAYTFSPRQPNPYQPTLGNDNISAVTSASFLDGLRFGNFSIGASLDIHHSQSYGPFQNPFTIIMGGAEVQWTHRRFQASLSAKERMNITPATLDSLGDLAGHGSGTEAYSAELKMAL